VSLSYFFLDRLVRRFVDFVECPFCIEALYVKAGDTLLVRPGSYNTENLSRGDVVIVGRRTGAVGETVFAVRQVHVTRVLAMPGDVVDVSDQGLFVNGSPISPDQVPDQDLPLPKEPLSTMVPEKTVFAMVPVGRQRGQARTGMPPAWSDAISLIWKNLFLVPVAQIQGRATGIYLPLSRRVSFKRVSTL
jgi:signal peptidase I